jgi:hypothetical protein
MAQFHLGFIWISSASGVSLGSASSFLFDAVQWGIFKDRIAENVQWQKAKAKAKHQIE